MNRYYIYCLLSVFVLFYTAGVQAQEITLENVSYTTADSLIFEDYANNFRGKTALSTAELLIETARYFLGTPYPTGALDRERAEKNAIDKLNVNLKQLNCMTLVETCLALTNAVKDEDCSFLSFCRHLAKLRYRGGVPGFIERLHYASDWAYENTQKGLFYPLSKEISATPVNKTLNYMSAHTKQYPELRRHPEFISQIKAVEKAINQRNTVYVLPKAKIDAQRSKLMNGDILLLSTTVDGLDYSHMGIACHVGDTLTFIHATSIGEKKVIINPVSLYDYCASKQRCDGITVLRLNN